MRATTIAALPNSLLEAIFLSLEPPDRRRVQAVSPRWRSVSRSSAALWEDISWTGSTDAAAQAASLGSFLAWHTWAHLGALLAHCAPRLQRLIILQDHPEMDRMDAVTPFIAAQCLPGIGTWLLPCQQLLQLDVEGPAPVEVLHQGVLHNVPAVERLRLAQNMSNWSGGMPAFDAVSAPVLSASLTSLDLAEADAQLQPGALAALPRLRRLALGSLQLADFDLLDEVQDGLEQFEFALYSGELPVEIGAFTRLKRLRISSWSGAVDPDPGEQLGDVLACLPLLEALSMATCWSLATSEQQQALWAAWTPATQRLRSLEVQCNGANELPPSAAPHLQQLHTLWCDFELLCNSPGILASCGQLRKLVFLVNGPPYGTSARPTPVMTARTIRQLAGNLAGLPHLAVVQCLNFRPSAGVATQLRAVAQSLLAEVHARLPRLGIPPVNLAGYEGGGTSDSIWDL